MKCIQSISRKNSINLIIIFDECLGLLDFLKMRDLLTICIYVQFNGNFCPQENEFFILVLKSTGSVNMSLIVWTICGFFTMIGAYCYAELGCMIRKSGADYAYIHTTFGPLAAFVRLWIECVIVRPCTGAIQVKTFSLKQ